MDVLILQLLLLCTYLYKETVLFWPEKKTPYKCKQKQISKGKGGALIFFPKVWSLQ